MRVFWTRRRLLLLILVPYVAWLIFGYRYHLLDGVNLLIHEASHIFFGFFGQTMHFLGGTLGQLLFPIAFCVNFYRRERRLEAWVVAIWACESLMYTAEYVGDARVQLLPLVGGHIHDWNWLLLRWGILDKAEDLGRTLHFVASLALIWCLFQAFLVAGEKSAEAVATDESSR